MNAIGVISTTIKLKTQLVAVDNPLLGARVDKGLISLGYWKRFVTYINYRRYSLIRMKREDAVV